MTDIDVLLTENRKFDPAPEFKREANVSSPQIYEEAARDPEKMTLPSFDCNNSGEKGPTNTPGCRVQGVVPFEGTNGRFPQVQEAKPGGVLNSSGG